MENFKYILRSSSPRRVQPANVIPTVGAVAAARVRRVGGGSGCRPGGLKLQCPAIATFSSFLLFFCHLHLWTRIGQSSAHRYYKTRVAAGDAHKISTDIRPMLPPFFTEGQNAQTFWPKFRPQSSSDRHIFERWQFIGKQKQTCQGPMIGLPPYQTLGRWVPPTLRTVGAMGTQKGKSGKMLIYPPLQRPTPSSRPPILHQQWGPGCAHKISTDIRPLLPPFLTRGENVHNFGPKLRPKSPSDRRIFEHRHYIGNQKQTW